MRNERSNFNLCKNTAYNIAFLSGRNGAGVFNRRQRKIRSHRIAILVVALVVAMAVLIFQKNNSIKVSAQSDKELYYKSIQVREGDTLWSIAEENMTDEWNSTRSYVDAIKKLNQKNSDSIYAGMYISIPYYH